MCGDKLGAVDVAVLVEGVVSVVEVEVLDRVVIEIQEVLVICAVLAPAAGELDADDVVVTGDDAAGGTVELGRC